MHFIGLLACSLTLGVTVGKAEAKVQYIRLGCGHVEGSWFQMCGGLYTLFNEKISNVNVSAVTGGSIASMRSLKQDKLEATFSHSLTIYDSWNGVGAFKKDGPWKGIRGLCGMYESWHHWVVLEKSGIKNMADLKGRRINVVPSGSGSAANSLLVLKNLGLLDKVKR